MENLDVLILSDMGSVTNLIVKIIIFILKLATRIINVPKIKREKLKLSIKSEGSLFHVLIGNDSVNFLGNAVEEVGSLKRNVFVTLVLKGAIVKNTLYEINYFI